MSEETNGRPGSASASEWREEMWSLRRGATFRAWVMVAVNEAPWYTRYIRDPYQRRTHCTAVFSKTLCSTQLGPTHAGGHFLLHLPTAIPGSQAQIFQSQSLMGSKGLAPHSHLDPCSRQSLVLSPTFPCCNEASVSWGYMFSALLQRCVSKTHPHLSTWASQSLWFRVCLPGPISISRRLCPPKSIGNHCQCNLFQGCSVHCTPCSNGLNDPFEDVSIYARSIEWRYVRELSALSSNL